MRLPTLSLLAGVALTLPRLFERVQVTGDSMRPALLPGDRLVVVRGLRARPGDIVTAADPRRPDRVVVKRVAEVTAAGVVVLGDDPASSTDSRHFGPVPKVRGRAVYRYAPAARVGCVTAAGTRFLRNTPAAPGGVPAPPAA